MSHKTLREGLIFRSFDTPADRQNAVHALLDVHSEAGVQDTIVHINNVCTATAAHRPAMVTEMVRNLLSWRHG